MQLNNLFTSKKFTIIISFVGLFLISIGVSLLVFYLVSGKSSVSTISKTGEKSKFDLSLPKTAECPINGQMYTKPESDVWTGRRPIIQMIENHVDARPESGLSRADVVYEAVAEGGITRFAAVFYCGAVAQDVTTAPLRSARVYFVNMAAGYGKDPLYLHQGEANNICNDCPGGTKSTKQVSPTVNVLPLFDKLGWTGGPKGNNLDGGYNIGLPLIQRDQYRLSSTPAAWEHSVKVDLDEVWKEAAKRGLVYLSDLKKWTFQDGNASASPTATDIKFDFWTSMAGYDVEWKYDSATNSYKRFNGGEPHIDWEFDKPQLTAKNVVIMLVKETGPVDLEHHMFYTVIGTGKAIIFQNGEAILGTWSKAAPTDREVFTDASGKVIQLVRGQTWVELVPAQNKISY